MPTQPICRCMSRPSLLLCRREEAMSPGHCSNLVHPCLTVYHMHQTKSLFLQHKTTAMFCMCLFHWLHKLLFLQHMTIAMF